MLFRHRFHIRMNDDLITALKRCKALGGRNFSEKIEGLLYFLKPILKKVLVREEEEYSHYQLVGNTKDVMIYMDEGIYRFIKKIHIGLNYYSMAQIIRRACKLFLRFVDKWGPEKAMEKIKKLIKSIQKTKKKTIDRRNFHKYLCGAPKLLPIMQVAYDALFRPIVYRQLE